MDVFTIETIDQLIDKVIDIRSNITNIDHMPKRI